MGDDIRVTEHLIMDKPATYWAFDPGETTGFAFFDEAGNVIRAGQIYGFDSLVGFLAMHDSSKLEAIVCEDFIILAKKARHFAGNKMEVIQAKGAIRAHAFSHKIKFVLQKSDIKPMAEKLTGIKPKGKHSDTHWVDAVNHGKYYLIKIGVAKGSLDARM